MSTNLLERAKIAGILPKKNEFKLKNFRCSGKYFLGDNNIVDDITNGLMEFENTKNNTFIGYGGFLSFDLEVDKEITFWAKCDEEIVDFKCIIEDILLLKNNNGEKKYDILGSYGKSNEFFFLKLTKVYSKHGIEVTNSIKMTTNQKEDIQPKIQKPMHQQVHPFFN
jgi:hypothetical protein